MVLNYKECSKVSLDLLNFPNHFPNQKIIKFHSLQMVKLDAESWQRKSDKFEKTKSEEITKFF